MSLWFALTSETSPASGDEIFIFFFCSCLCACQSGFDGSSAFLLSRARASFHSHSLASRATATELILAKCCNRRAIMFLEVCIAPDSQVDEFFNKLSSTTYISFLYCLESPFTHAALAHTGARDLSGQRGHRDIRQAKVKCRCTYR